MTAAGDVAVLNESGRFMIAALVEEDHTMEEVIGLLMQEYEIDWALAERDVTHLVSELVEKRFLEIKE